jgi:PAS domain S-box-containing protein
MSMGRWRNGGGKGDIAAAPHPHARGSQLLEDTANDYQPTRAAVTVGRFGTAVPAEHLDLATVIRVSQALSDEILLDKLIDTTLRTAIEYGGAERGMLLLPYRDRYRIAAEATAARNDVTICHKRPDGTAADLPESVVDYVLRTKESVLLPDATDGKNAHSHDEYLRQGRARSVLCLPLLKQRMLLGVIYLENNLTPHVFTPARMAILGILASQAAISLENSRLYSELQEREARVRRLVDANIIGIVIWSLDGRILEANEAFLRLVGHRRQDLLSGRIKWQELAAPDRGAGLEPGVSELQSTGTTQPYETECLHSSGARVPVLIGSAKFAGTQEQGVSFVVDLTERKRAEQAVRESERRYLEVELALAHANRLATVGQLSASIAHEIKQPIAAAVTNAQAALNWLTAEPPQIEEARLAIGRIVHNGMRAGDVMGRIRALLQKTPSRNDWLDINEAILEVVGLTRDEVTGSGVSVRTQLAEALPLVHGDRVQLQQVILNLMINSLEAMSGASTGPRELLISTVEAEPDVLVTVSDSGPGFAPGGPERIFEAFYTTKPGGLGIGLSICCSIVEAHGGRLWASVNEPTGATLQFTLPKWVGPL